MTRAIFLLVLVSSVAQARELKKPAREARDAGVLQYNAGRFASAIVEFERAYELDPDPSLLFSLAQAERRAGKCSAALGHYEKYLASNPNDEQTAATREGLAWCEGNLAAGVGKLPWYKDPGAGAITAGGVLLASGIGFLIAGHASHQIAETMVTVATAAPARARANGQRHIGEVLVSFGALLVGGGVYYHVVTERRAASTRRTSVAFDGRTLYITRAF